MGKVVGNSTRRTSKRKTPSMRTNTNNKVHQDQGKDEKETIRMLLQNLNDILPETIDQRNRRQDATTIVERAAEYITELEKKLGRETIALLHSNPDFYKLFNKK